VVDPSKAIRRRQFSLPICATLLLYKKQKINLMKNQINYNLTTVSIGIPSYNEESNILGLLESITRSEHNRPCPCGWAMIVLPIVIKGITTIKTKRVTVT
jgi:hypothetical protein